MSSLDDNSMESRKNLSHHLEDKEIQEILKSGTDLRQYSQQIEKDLKAVENQSIEEYIKESQNIACLHNQIGDCDNILERMEAMLTNFQVINLFMWFLVGHAMPIIFIKCIFRVF